METNKLVIEISDSIGSVSAEIISQERMELLFVFAHGAGAGMNHPFMADLSRAMAARGMGTLRYNFPYMERGNKRPDPPAIAEKAVKSAITKARKLFPDLPILAGGKSFGGRMTSQALAKEMDLPVKGIIFVGFPLHPAGNPSTERALHLQEIAQPMLFLQGTRDALANITLIESVCKGLPRASLHKFDGADHSFKAGKQDLIPALAETIREWARKAT